MSDTAVFPLLIFLALIAQLACSGSSERSGNPSTVGEADPGIAVSGASEPEVPGEIPILAPGGPRAATGLEAQVRCDQARPRQGLAELRWQVASTRGSQQQVGVTIFRDGFETGQYEISELLPAAQSGLTWGAVNGQAIHLWKVFTLQPEGWAPSEIASFQGPTCVADFVEPPAEPQ